LILINGILYACRFTLTSDKEWFDKELINMVTEVLGPEYSKMAEPNHVFVDFMRYCYHSSVWGIYPCEFVCAYSYIMYVGNSSLISVIRELLVLMLMNFLLWFVGCANYIASYLRRPKNSLLLVCVHFSNRFPTFKRSMTNLVWEVQHQKR